MIRIGKKTSEPLRLDLGGGAYIMHRQMTSIDREAGLATARRFIERARGGVEAFADYGVSPSSNWIEDADLAIGVAALINLVEMALRVCVGWHGVAGEDGGALALDRASLTRLLEDPLYFSIVQQGILTPLIELDAEGNESAPSPNGGPEGASTIAAAAAQPGPPAPAESAA